MKSGLVTLTAGSAHMGFMEKLIADLKDLGARHAASPGRDFGALLGNLNAIIALAEASTPAAKYRYRHHLGWDTTWLDLPEGGSNDFFRFQHGSLKSEYTDYRTTATPSGG